MIKRKLIQLTPKTQEQVRIKQYKKQNKKCAVLNVKMPLSEMALDHKHKLKSEKPGIEGKGLCRGIINKHVNRLEGKISKSYVRYGIKKYGVSLSDLLRNLADYLENPPMKQIYIHKSEKPKKAKLGKRDYNRICKYYFKIYPRRKKLPKYPKSGKTNKNWEKLLKKVNKLQFKGKL